MDLLERYKRLTYPHPYRTSIVVGFLVGVLVMSIARDIVSGLCGAIGLFVLNTFYAVGSQWERKH